MNKERQKELTDAVNKRVKKFIKHIIEDTVKYKIDGDEGIDYVLNIFIAIQKTISNSFGLDEKEFLEAIQKDFIPEFELINEEVKIQ